MERSECLEKVARTLRLSDDDNVVVATERTEPGATVAGGITAHQRIPFGHKFAIRPIAAGEAVVKFGQIIGFASKPIAAGDWVHEHNCDIGEEHGAFERDYAVRARARVPVDFVPVEEQRAPSRVSAAPTARSARATMSAS